VLEVDHQAQRDAGWTLHLRGDFGEFWVAGYGGWTSALTFTSLGGALLEIDRHLALLRGREPPPPIDVAPWVLEFVPVAEDERCSVLKPRYALLHGSRQPESMPPHLSVGPSGFIGHSQSEDAAYDALSRNVFDLK